MKNKQGKKLKKGLITFYKWNLLNIKNKKISSMIIS